MRSLCGVLPVAVGIFALCAGCAHRGTAGLGPVLLEARRAELRALWQSAEDRARRGSFVTVLSELFSPEGVHAMPGAIPRRGPAAVRAWLERDSLNTRSTARWTTLRLDVSADGRDGYTYGYFDAIRPSGDTLLGRYHAYWRRAADGRWEILAFSRGAREPGAPTDSLPSDLLPPAAPSRSFPAVRDSAEVLDEVFRTERRFSDSAAVNVAAAFGGFAAPDAGKCCSGSAWAFGRGAIARLFAVQPPGNLGPVWTPQIGSVAASNDLAFTMGPAWPRKAGTDQGPPPPGAGRYFTIWRRQPSGEWRYVVD